MCIENNWIGIYLGLSLSVVTAVDKIKWVPYVLCKKVHFEIYDSIIRTVQLWDYNPSPDSLLFQGFTLIGYSKTTLTIG